MGNYFHDFNRVKRSGDTMTGPLNLGLNALILNDGTYGGLIKGAPTVANSLMMRNMADDDYAQVYGKDLDVRGNIYMQAAATVDGVDISALLITCAFFAPVTFGSNMAFLGHRPVAHCTGQDDHGFTSFRVPHDFTSITSAELLVIPRDTVVAADWDIYCEYAAEGEAYTTHEEADAASTYNVTADQLFAIDTSGLLTNLAAGDVVGVDLAKRAAAGQEEVDVLGVRFRYAQ